LPQDSKLQDKLVTYIEDAYAMENQIVEALQKQMEQTRDVPTVQARIRQHLAATEQHRQRMESRLAAYDKRPSAVKGFLSNIMGNTQGVMSGARADALAMTARDDYMIEHFEIAAYTLLITTARAFGDEETVRACELNLRDEIDMQTWLAQHLPEAALLSLRQDGITVPQAAWDVVRQAQTSGIAGLFGATDIAGGATTVSPPA
jgi:ferritin-like metal-binding protein YciE